MQNDNISLEWKKWISNNLRRGCRYKTIRKVLQDNNFDNTLIENAINLAAEEIKNSPQENIVNKNYIYTKSRMEDIGNIVKTSDKDIIVSLKIDKPFIVLFDNVLTYDECNTIIELAKPKITRSSVVDGSNITQTSVLSDNRTSYGTWFSKKENSTIAVIEKRISELIRWPEDNIEAMQILNYQIGQEYKAHHDYFHKNANGNNPHISNSGQRISTFLMYLNDVESGGETMFPKINLSVVPKKGSAVYFEYFNDMGQVDDKTLHWAKPVISGEKWVATKWSRQFKL